MSIKGGIKIIILLIISIISFVGFSSKVFSYSTTPTHPNLTKEMIRLYNMVYDPDIIDEKVRLILQGSIDEDMAPRWTFHLYDPIYNRAPFGVYTAKQWAINSDVQGGAIHKFANLLFNLFGKKESEFSHHGDFSWAANVNNYAKNKKTEAWYGLGHILHLVEDMTVPAHSRNDHHIFGDPLESWTGTNLKDSDYIFADKLYQNGNWPIDVDYLSEAIDDLAEYSNKYFFSKDTILSKDYDYPKFITERSEDFGLVSQNHYMLGYDEQGKLFRLAQKNPPKSAWYDVSPYAQDLNLKDNYFIDGTDSKINSDYFQRLAPKAIQYGAGVIRLFVVDAEYEAKKIAQQNSKQKAQVLDPSTSSEQVSSTPPGGNSLNNNLPEIKPSRLPATANIIVEEPEIADQNNKTDPSSPVGYDEANKFDPSAGEAGKTDKTNETTIQSSPSPLPPYQGDGGLSQGIIDQINAQSESELEPEPEPEPEPEQCLQTGPTIINDHTIISENTTWTKCLSPYYLETNFGQWPIIENGATLTIEPGVVVMPRNTYYTSLEIRGTLKVEGTTNERVVFTSENDSEYGGSGSAAAGDWLNIVFTPTSQNSVLKNVIFRYGGKPVGFHNIESEMIKVNNTSITAENMLMEKSKTRCLHLINSSSVISNATFKECKVGALIEGTSDSSTIENSFFENNFEHGLQVIDNAAPVISNNQFNNNGQIGIDTKYPRQGAIVIYGAYPQFSNNSLNNNLLNGALVYYRSVFSQNLEWNDDMPYIIISSAGEFTTIDQGATLTIDPNAIIKLFGPYTALLVKGTLKAEANSGSEIIFTSLKDDNFGEDTNNDSNATIPATGDWDKIKFDSTSTGSVFDHVIMRYGTGTPPIFDPNASVDIKDVIE